MSNKNHYVVRRLDTTFDSAPSNRVRSLARLNAVSHGLLSQETLLPGEDLLAFNAFCEKCLALYQPQGIVEEMLVDRIASSFWRLRRAVRLEKQASRFDPFEDGQEDAVIVGADYRYESWQRCMRYETALENQVFKSMHELERLQRARSGENVPPPFVAELGFSSSLPPA